ncbi:hypothetical protein U1Q18_029304 [Sarracenia purpurea var. burkii]
MDPLCLCWRVERYETRMVLLLNEQIDGVLGNNSRGTYPRPSAPEMDDLPAYSNDIEVEMVQAVIEASKREVGVVKCV